MPTCNQCGEEIEFRYVDGRCVPIHPGGGWHCGSFSKSPYSPPRISRSGEWRERDFTRPSHCPICGDDVFFIRHNGGSVWVDELGWPWPKHGCFDQPHEPTQTFSLWTAKSSGLTNPKLAIITRIKEDVRFAEPILEIRFTDSSRASLILRYTPSTSSLLGALVAISKEDSLLLHQQHAELPFHSFTPLVTTDAKGYYKCPLCKAWVNENTGHEEYCRKQHDKGVSTKAKQTPRKKQRDLRTKPSAKRAVVPQDAEPSNSSEAARVTNQALASSQPVSGAPTDEQIREAVESVAKQAWAAVSSIPEPSRLKQAKQAALRVLRLLPRSIHCDSSVGLTGLGQARLVHSRRMADRRAGIAHRVLPRLQRWPSHARH